MGSTGLRIVMIGPAVTGAVVHSNARICRGLAAALSARGHDLLYLEPGTAPAPWGDDTGVRRDVRVGHYADVGALAAWRGRMAASDAVILASGLADSVAVARVVQASAGGIAAFYDLDAPATLDRLAAGEPAELTPDLVRLFDLYLSTSGGPAPRRVERAWGAPCARALYAAADPAVHRPVVVERRWDLGWFGTPDATHRPLLDRLLVEPARRMPRRRFVVAGPPHPDEARWPGNVERAADIPNGDVATFYASLGWALAPTTERVRKEGWTPGVSLFEAAGCGTPLIANDWPGLSSFLTPGSEIAIVERAEDVVRALERPEPLRLTMARAARARMLAAHTTAHRARSLEAMIRGLRTASHAGPLTAVRVA